MSCELCERTAFEHWIGDGRISHCRHCHAGWKRTTNACHCNRCHVTFGAPAIADEHEISGECDTPESLGLVGRVSALPFQTEVWWRSSDTDDEAAA